MAERSAAREGNRACTTALMLLFDRLRAHVMAAERLHSDDTTSRCWRKARWKSPEPGLMCDNRPFGGTALSAALFYYSRDRGGEHPQAHLAEYACILQADAYTSHATLYDAD